MDFSYFAPAYLIKSGTAKAPIYKVGGTISTEEKDIDGEIIKAVDLSYFTGGFGKLKYEHNSKDNKEPNNIWGAPTRVFKSGKNLNFEGEAFSFDENAPESQLSYQQQTAKSAIGLLKSVGEWNERHPNNPQKVGWSIEGDYLEKDKKTGICKARIVNVVLTNSPRNMNTSATLLKSLEVGYGTSPESQSGFGATRVESIDRGEKDYTDNKKSNIKELNMYKSKEECFKDCLQKGMSEEEAVIEANKWEAKQKKKERGNEFNPDEGGILPKGNEPPMEENVGKSLKLFLKSSDLIDEVLEKSIDSEVSLTRRSFRKSLATNNNEEIDFKAYLETQQDAEVTMLSNQELLGDKIDSLAKSLKSAIIGFSSLAKSLSGVDYKQNLNAKANAMMIKSLSGQSYMPTDLIQNTEYEDNNIVENVTLSKSNTLKVLAKLEESKEVSQPDVLMYETNNYMSNEVAKLVKSRANSILK